MAIIDAEIINKTSTIKGNLGNTARDIVLRKMIEDEIKRAIGRENEIQDYGLENYAHTITATAVHEPTGLFTLSLLNSKNEVISTVEIDLPTEKIIKQVDLDYDNEKLIFTLYDETTIECDLTDLIEPIHKLERDLAQEIQDRIADVDEEEARAKAAEKDINDRIDAMDLAEVGQNGDYIKYVSQQDGQLSAQSQSFDRTVSDQSTDNNAPTSKAVWDVIDSLDLATVGETGSYIKTVSQSDGQVSATKEAFDTSLVNATDGNAPTSKTVKDYVDNSLDALDYGPLGQAGYYIDSIQQTNGQLSGTKKQFDTNFNNPTDNNTPTTKAVDDRINSLDLAQVGANGSYIKYTSQTDGQVSATAQAFDLTLNNADDTNAPTSKTVKDYVDNTIDSLDVAEVGENGKYIQKIKEVDGKIQTTLKEFATTLDATDTTTALTNKAVTDAITSEAETRAAADTAINTRIDNLDLNTLGEDGYYIKTVGQQDGQLSATKQVFDREITASASNDNVPSTLAAKGYTDAETSRAQAAEQAIVDTINGLDYGPVGADGKYIKTVKQLNGKVEATLQDFDVTLNNPTDDNAPTTKAVKDAFEALDLATVGGGGAYIKYVGQTDGQVSANFQLFDTTINAQSTNNNAPTSLAVENRIKDLDVASVGSSGSYLKTISEADGLISATPEAFDTTIDANSDDNNAPTSLAVKTYVDTYGGKIDSITIDSVTMPIVNKNVEIPAVRTDINNQGLSSTQKTNAKTNLDLENVVNTGDSATPTQNGTTKFTTGGAYTLQTNLETAISTVDDKLNVNVHIEGSSDEISYSGDTVTKTSPYQNLKTGTTGSRSEVIHLANATTAGLMSHTDYNTIQDNKRRIDALEGTPVRLIYTASQNPTASDIKTFVDTYLAGKGITNPTDSDYNSVSVKINGTNHIWNYYANDGAYKDDGLDTVTQFTNSIAGIIKGKSGTAGFVYAESDGTGSVYGWDALINRVGNVETDLGNKLDKVTGTTSFNQVYAKTAAGVQYMNNINESAEGYSLARRQSNGQLTVSQTPIAATDAASKDYVDTTVGGEATARATEDAKKLNKVTTTTTAPQAYIKNADGTQGMIDVAQSQITDTIVRRDGTQILVPTTPTGSQHATSKDYVDTSVGAITTLLGTFDEDKGGTGKYIERVQQVDGKVSAVEKSLETDILNNTEKAPTAKAVKAYVDTYGGKIDSLSVNSDTLTITNKNVDIPAVRYDINNEGLTSTQKLNARTNIGLENVDNTSDANKPISTAAQTALDTKLNKVTSATTYDQAYIKLADGTQSMRNVTSSVVNDAIVQRNSSGQVLVPETPTADGHAASKKYVENTITTALTNVAYKNTNNNFSAEQAIASATDNSLLYLTTTRNESPNIRFLGQSGHKGWIGFNDTTATVWDAGGTGHPIAVTNVNNNFTQSQTILGDSNTPLGIYGVSGSSTIDLDFGLDRTWLASLRTKSDKLPYWVQSQGSERRIALVSDIPTYETFTANDWKALMGE